MRQCRKGLAFLAFAKDDESATPIGTDLRKGVNQSLLIFLFSQPANVDNHWAVPVDYFVFSSSHRVDAS
jgi:hypothetical protein